MTALLEVQGLAKHFPVKRGLLQRMTGQVRALDRVDIGLDEGETYALVGESGSGKTTLGRCVLRLIEPTSGRILFRGDDIAVLSRRELRRRRRFFQMIFQDPYGSLNPRMRVVQIVGEPLAVHRLVERQARRAEVERLLDLVGLDSGALDRYPHEFSGGQRQRIGIARALATRPQLIVADEPVSALDVSVQAQIINLLEDLKVRLGLTLLFISHDLAVVHQIADRVGVLYLGRLVEEASSGRLFSRPQHPYTISLLSAVPVPVPVASPGPEPQNGRTRLVLPGEPPSSVDPPSGCRFHPRCPIAQARCETDPPVLASVADGHSVACHFPGELLAAEVMGRREAG
ncbi:MAG: ABC transporter ATP-binding protein [Acidobacteriota bacterium]|nr:ABC transporter ATP-binding protein [Acidobacteriota bacterium]